MVAASYPLPRKRFRIRRGGPNRVRAVSGWFHPSGRNLNLSTDHFSPPCSRSLFLKHCRCRRTSKSLFPSPTRKLDAGHATLHGCVKDRENGKLTYEVETLKHGKSKDIPLDVSGTVLEVEQEVAPSSLPPAVSDAIAKAAHSSKIGKVEFVRESAIANYETTITSNGQRREVASVPRVLR